MNVFVADEQGEPVDVAVLRGLAERVLTTEGYPDRSEVSILLIEEDHIAELNARFLDREGATDVLAFPIEHLTPGRPPRPLANGPPLLLGDVLIAPAYVRRQAEQNRGAFEDEMALMVVHGVLHLLGYDHHEDADAELMGQRERRLLAARPDRSQNSRWRRR